MSILTIPDDPANDYLMVAFRMIQNARRELGLIEPMIRRQDIMLSCISSFLSLEAAINRLHYETFETQEGSRRKINSSVPSSWVAHIKKSWSRQLSVQDKYLLFPPLISDPKFEFLTTTESFSLFVEFNNFRNRLIHPKMKERLIMVVEHRVSAPEGDSMVKEIIDEQPAGPGREKAFPLTNFATTFQGLTTKDAETAFEIAVRMRLILFYRLGALAPRVAYEKSDGSIIFNEGPEVATLVDLRFGMLPNETWP